MKQNYTLRDIINQYQKEICYYNQMQITAVSAYEKNYYHGLIKERTESFIHTMEQQTDNSMMDNSQTSNGVNENVDNQNQIENGTNVNEETGQSNNPTSTIDQQTDVLREITPDELATFNGKNGMPIYVAVNGIVYDVTTAPAWFGGMHFAGLTAGKDLTDRFLSCHKNMLTVLDKYPKVGILKTEDMQ
ncbi:MAG: steroid-binding protein [Anaerocolumna sp.]|nr:steroid-binding protein [Anaerocolumna sp.]